MALQYHGLAGYRAAIDRDIELAQTLADSIRTAPDFELFEPQGLSIVCFRHVPRGGPSDSDAIDALNKALLERLQLSGRVFVSSTAIEGRFWLRACIVNPRAAEDDVRSIPETIRDIARDLG
jgi:glutamate/tyrosine decarboxylase-like PLP-dependent enzyme